MSRETSGGKTARLLWPLFLQKVGGAKIQKTATFLFGDRGGGECVSGILAGQEKAYPSLSATTAQLPLLSTGEGGLENLSLTEA
jgi:hypothetical protein